MNWHNPYRQKEKINRCEFCGTDVSTPYKGVHDEFELILGIPQPCRNNGRMNMHIAWGYMTENKPKEGIKYFVEHPETRLWWSGHKWTNDPHEAFACELESTADRYARFQKADNKITDYVITEHMFL